MRIKLVSVTTKLWGEKSRQEIGRQSTDDKVDKMYSWQIVASLWKLQDWAGEFDS